MTDNVFQVEFSLFREVFEGHAIEDDFMIFDNLMEKINPEGNTNPINYNFPIKLDITILVLCTGGIANAKIGLKEISLKKNRLAVIMPDQIFQVTEITPDFKGMFIILKNTFFNTQNYFVEAMTLQRIILQQHYFEIPESFIAEFKVIYNLIKEKIKEKNNYYKSQIIQNYCSILFYNACSIYVLQNSEADIKEKTRKQGIVETFVKEVERNYRKEHTISFYADKLCLTPKYLSSIISDMSGKSAADWIKEYLILEAQALLRSTKMTIQQVSDHLNFANQSHFGRFFKRFTGLSPREYQKQ
ncbi:MAG: AraC family transcriptional regulator [Bacteroidales bacterium]|jgi:AraC-like DNA-binding protein|nr:AraC family transcriptional regulator [Bacteroidales bacterium]